MKPSAAIFINPPTALQAKLYSENQDALLRHIRDDGDNIEMLPEVAHVSRATFGVDLEAEIASPSLIRRDADGFQARMFEIMLQAVEVEIIALAFDVKCVAGYSGGFLAAAIASGGVSVAQLVGHIMPVIGRDRSAGIEAWRGGARRSALLCNMNNDGFYNFIRDLALDGYRGEVKLKDNRPPYAAVVVADGEVLPRFAEDVFAEYPEARAQSQHIRKDDGSHVDQWGLDEVVVGLRALRANTITCTLVDSWGGCIKTGDERRLPGTIFHGLFSPLNTASVWAALAQANAPVVAIGPDFYTQYCLHGVADQQRPAAVHSANVFFSRGALSPATLIPLAPDGAFNGGFSGRAKAPEVRNMNLKLA
ncbi:MAG: hypothetical protein ABW199_01060 [Caulobacterales bacterium]